MARYKIVDRSPRFLPVVLEAQLMSGSFEYALDYLIDQQLDLSRLDRRYHNNATGCSAYDPRVMLKITLLAYSRGMISSRSIERMKQAIDSPEGRRRYGQRMATVEPVFGIRSFTSFSS